MDILREWERQERLRFVAETMAAPPITIRFVSEGAIVMSPLTRVVETSGSLERDKPAAPSAPKPGDDPYHPSP